MDIIFHIQRQEDAARIAEIASENEVTRILVGMATGEDGRPNFTGSKALRLAAAIRDESEIEVEMVDETRSTRDAVLSRKKRGMSNPASHGHHDSEAAAVVLQYYLDTLPPPNTLPRR